MSREPTARLLNAHGRVTLHQCVRLEVRGTGYAKSIYPVYRCTATGTERDYGCLRAGTSTAQLGKLFPDVELVYAEHIEAGQAGDERAA